MKIAIVYFSATGNTEKIAGIIKEQLVELKNEVIEVNITNSTERENFKSVDPYEAMVFGFPVHYWRAPRLIREWLTTINGKGTRCAVFFTYGGVHVGLAHYDIKEILDKQKFNLVASAEFLGKHTYNLGGWNLMKTHPNTEDFEMAKEFTLKVYERFLEKNLISVEFDKPRTSSEKIDKIEQAFKRAIPSPYRETEDCSMCGTCEDLCPVNAMDKERGKPNRRLCIRCFRCVVSCPDEILKMKDFTYGLKYMEQSTNLTEEVLNSRKSKIIL